MFDLINKIITKIKTANPLILNITNHVTIDFVANGLLSIGASPVMSFAKEEMRDLIKLADAIVINLGTLNKDFVELCKHASEIANEFNKPIILDPVGAGASIYRTETSLMLINNYQISVIRANASEIMALTGSAEKTKGVDSTAFSNEAIKYAEILSAKYSLTICMSGATDIIMTKGELQQFNRGSLLMPMITGTGCLLSAVVAAFKAVHSNSFEAAYAASYFYAVCGEIAEKQSNGPGSFKINFLDCLSKLPEETYYD